MFCPIPCKHVSFFDAWLTNNEGWVLTLFCIILVIALLVAFGGLPFCRVGATCLAVVAVVCCFRFFCFVYLSFHANLCVFVQARGAQQACVLQHAVGLAQLVTFPFPFSLPSSSLSSLFMVRWMVCKRRQHTVQCGYLQRKHGRISSGCVCKLQRGCVCAS